MKFFGILFVLLILFACQSEAQNKEDNANFEIHKTSQQWHAELSTAQFQVLRLAATEPRYSSPILKISNPGTLVCAACENPVFLVENKYDAKCGWPSFDRALKNSVVYQPDYKLGYERTEVLCAKCGGHLGHVFDDGPRQTTGKRYCINGVALKYVAANQKAKNNE